MGEFRNIGEPAAALAEECSEVIKVIAKKIRFNEDWDTMAPDHDATRWQQLVSEMDDLFYQWERLKRQINRQEVPVDKS